jgi:hypothetical protein
MKCTQLDPEEYAYPSGALRNSRRHFSAICLDGKVRRGTCGVPDTFFSIPARLKAKGKTVTGYVTIDSSDGEIHFHAYLYGKNHEVLR